jgi:hypothetical protein
MSANKLLVATAGKSCAKRGNLRSEPPPRQAAHRTVSGMFRAKSAKVAKGKGFFFVFLRVLRATHKIPSNHAATAARLSLTAAGRASQF